MATTEAIQATGEMDAQLVAKSLEGNRDAFRQIVERHQSLICSLAYSAVGNLAQSEDLAQETFLTAWKQLGQLGEPAKLRAWLRGILRCLIGKELRRRGQAPLDTAEPLDSVVDIATPEPLPPDQLMTKEEAALLWRALERIPIIYREPLVLFYREQESVQAVAAALGLSEDAVKQRLLRGRKLLQDQIATYVERALQKSRPGQGFTLAVLGALSLVSTTARAAVATAAAKGTASTKGGTAMAMIGALVTGGIICYLSLAAFFTLLGAGLGYVMSRASERSVQQREYVARFWRILALGLPALTLVPSWCIWSRPESVTGHLALDIGMSLSLGLTFLLTLLTFGTWTWRWRRGLGQEEAGVSSERTPAQRRFVLWIVLAMVSLAPAFCLSHAMLWETSTWTKKHLSADEARRLILERKDAQIHVSDSQQGWKYLSIVVPKEKITYVLLADEETLNFLKTNGVAYQSQQQDQNAKSRRIALFGWMLPFVGLIAVSLEPAGAVLLLRRPRRRLPMSAGVASQRSQKIETRIFKTFACVLALGLAALGLVLLTLTPWGLRPVSRADAPQLIQLYQDTAEFQLVQRSYGANELWITLRNRIGLLRGPDFVIAADESFRAFLAAQGVEYRTLVQGRDFGYSYPKKWVAVIGCLLLGVSSAALLFWAIPKTTAGILAVFMAATGSYFASRLLYIPKSLSAAEVREMIEQRTDAHVQLFWFKNGSQEVWITWPDQRKARTFASPADAETLSLLTNKNIPYETMLEGRDFGYGEPSRAMALVWGFCLLSGAMGMIWWVKKELGKSKQQPVVN